MVTRRDATCELSVRVLCVKNNSAQFPPATAGDEIAPPCLCVCDSDMLFDVQSSVTRWVGTVTFIPVVRWPESARLNVCHAVNIENQVQHSTYNTIASYSRYFNQLGLQGFNSQLQQIIVKLISDLHIY